MVQIVCIYALSGPEFTHPVVYSLSTTYEKPVGCGVYRVWGVGKLSSNLPKKRDMNGLLPYKFVWEEVPPILYGADTLLYDPLALFEGKGTFV